jgi:hypothetical protein
MLLQMKFVAQVLVYVCLHLFAICFFIILQVIALKNAYFIAVDS